MPITPVEVTFNSYQKLTHLTAVYPPEHSMTYLALGAVGEAGELANQVKKMIRDDGSELTIGRKAKLIDEMGDVLWYLSELCSSIEVQLEFVAVNNINKLEKRKMENDLKGDKRNE